MKKFFISFGDSRMSQSASRIKQQALDMEAYDDIFVLNEDDLDNDFKAKFKQYLVLGIRGYGYWCWKPQIILQVLEKMDDGDILNYVDMGCHLSKDGQKRLLEYFDIVDKSASGILAFDMSFNVCKTWTKGDLLDYFNVRDDKSITESGQIASTSFFLKKNPETVDIIKQWLKVYEDDFSLITDKPSKSPNLKRFIEHRHDQAVFSILCRLNNVELLPYLEELEPVTVSHGVFTWNMQYPILAKRDRSLPPQKTVGFLPIFIKILCTFIPFKFYRKKLRILWGNTNNWVKLTK